MRVVESAGCGRFAQEALLHVMSPGAGLHQLDGDGAVELELTALIDPAHPPFLQKGLQFILLLQKEPSKLVATTCRERTEVLVTAGADQLMIQGTFGARGT